MILIPLITAKTLPTTEQTTTTDSGSAGIVCCVDYKFVSISVPSIMRASLLLGCLVATFYGAAGFMLPNAGVRRTRYPTTTAVGVTSPVCSGKKSRVVVGLFTRTAWAVSGCRCSLKADCSTVKCPYTCCRSAHTHELLLLYLCAVNMSHVTCHVSAHDLPCTQSSSTQLEDQN